MKFVVTNAFSLNMCNPDTLASGATINIAPVSPSTAHALLQTYPWESAIGHADMAAIVSAWLSTEVPYNRITVDLGVGDWALVAQYTGPRLPEGTTVLPEGAQIQFYIVDIAARQ